VAVSVQLELETEEKAAAERERQLMERELEAERSRAQVLLCTGCISLCVRCHLMVLHAMLRSLIPRPPTSWR